MLFGANCTLWTQCQGAQRFIKPLVSDIKGNRKEDITLAVNGNGSPVKFFAELPNDMKMMAFLDGEPPDSAKNFSNYICK